MAYDVRHGNYSKEFQDYMDECAKHPVTAKIEIDAVTRAEIDRLTKIAMSSAYGKVVERVKRPDDGGYPA